MESGECDIHISHTMLKPGLVERGAGIHEAYAEDSLIMPSLGRTA